MRVRLTSHLFLVLVSFVAAACGSKVLKNAEQLLELGQCDQARPILEKFVQESPQNPDAFVLLGDARFCLAEKEGGRKGFRSALEAYESAYKLEASSPVVALHLALGRLFTGDMDGALQTLREGFKYNPKDVALREYLGIVLRIVNQRDPAVSKEVETLVQSLDVGKGWQQLPAYQERDNRAHRTFIVTKDNISLKLVEGGNGGTLPRWSVSLFQSEEGDSLRFADLFHPETQMRIGYTGGSAFARGCYKPGERAKDGISITGEPTGVVVGKIGQEIQWAKCLGATEGVHVGWYFQFKVQYPWQVYHDKLVRTSDVVLGVGEETVDKARAEVLATVGAKLNPDLVTHLLNGELRPGLPHVMVNAVLGQTQPPLTFKGGALNTKVARSVVEVNGLTLTYEDGLLSSWKGEWRSGAEDQDYDSQ